MLTLLRWVGGMAPAQHMHRYAQDKPRSWRAPLATRLPGYQVLPQTWIFIGATPLRWFGNQDAPNWHSVTVITLRSLLR